MMLIRWSYELIKSWRYPVRRQQYLLFLMQSSPKSATRPMRKAHSPGWGNFPSEMENGWENQQEPARGVCNTAGIHPWWPRLGLGLSPLQLKRGSPESLSQIQQCHQHFCLLNSILMYFLLKLWPTWSFWNIVSRASTSQENWICQTL